jgi:predicted O-methyltransferase YrrM
MKDLFGSLEHALHQPLDSFQREPALREIEAHVLEASARMLDKGPFNPLHNGDLGLARLCYVLCRATKPQAVVETGVAYGVTSAFILQALAANEVGSLQSIDLPPLTADSDQYVGALIPQHLRQRWKLYRGDSKRLLPKVLSETKRVDVFLHDSLHTYGHMKWEFRTARSFLSSSGILISDDVEGNRAFLEFRQQARPKFWATAKEERKPGLLGVALFGTDANASLNS